jgi:hypothetical protein
MTTQTHEFIFTKQNGEVEVKTIKVEGNHSEKESRAIAQAKALFLKQENNYRRYKMVL